MWDSCSPCFQNGGVVFPCYDTFLPSCYLLLLGFSFLYKMSKDPFGPRSEKIELGRFRHVTNRNMEILVQQELDSVTKKTLNQINAFKAARQKVPLSEEQETVRYANF